MKCDMKKTPLKIVYCTPALYMAGGVERVLTLKANYFADHFGYDITIILTEGKDKPLFYPLSDKIKVINYGINFEELWTCSFTKKIFVYLKKQRLFKKLLTKELMRIRPDITVSLLRREINFINGIKDGSRKVGEMHVNRDNYRNIEDGNASVVKRLFAKCWSANLLSHLKKLDAFVVLTQNDYENWVELDNVCVIPNPSPFVSSSVSLLTEKRVIAVARYAWQKGIDMLLHAWAEVEKQTEEWRLDVYGDGDTSSYEKIINDLGLDRNRCRLNGRTSNVEHEYCQSSLFVLSSRYEGFGMVIVEAMACGLPVVSFNCPWGPSSIIQDGENGILVENGNIPALAQGLVCLINDADKRKAMSIAALQNAQRYNIGQIAQQWKELFDNLMVK